MLTPRFTLSSICLEPVSQPYYNSEETYPRLPIYNIFLSGIVKRPMLHLQRNLQRSGSIFRSSAAAGAFILRAGSFKVSTCIPDQEINTASYTDLQEKVGFYWRVGISHCMSN